MLLGRDERDEPIKPLTPIEEKAWDLYCNDTAGGMDVRDFWHELPPAVQLFYLEKVDG